MLMVLGVRQDANKAIFCYYTSRQLSLLPAVSVYNDYRYTLTFRKELEFVILSYTKDKASLY